MRAAAHTGNKKGGHAALLIYTTPIPTFPLRGKENPVVLEKLFPSPSGGGLG